MDFFVQMLIFLALKIIIVTQYYNLHSLKTKRETQANDKISEYQTILNTFPEGFFMASYRANSQIMGTPQ